MEYIDYYATLGVPKDASKEAITRAYRRLARKHHPDVNKERGAEERFKRISEAYEVLKDPEKRARYDRFGAAWQSAQKAPPSAGSRPFRFEFGGRPQDAEPGDLFGGSGFSSFFEHLFGGQDGQRDAWGFGVSPEAFDEQAGPDHEATLSLSLEEALQGGRRTVSLESPDRGRRRSYSVQIPAGARDGQRLRLAGQGGSGPRRSGDLYLVVRLEPHPRFRLEGADLHTVLEVPPWVAALGGKARLTTLDGRVAVSVPAGASSGRQIRLKGKGYLRAGGQRGDLYAELHIAVPKQLSDEERRLYERLAKLAEGDEGND